MKILQRLLLILSICSAQGARAYITSAQLEYSVDDFTQIMLNGETVLERSGRHWADYAVLSTSDGTLPLEYFKLNGENLLAIRAINVDGLMDMSYRLTVHHSSGDPVVIWGDTDSTRFLHLKPGQKAPPGWDSQGFDDSAWEHPLSVGAAGNYFMLSEPALAGFLGGGAYVPHLSHKSDAKAGNGDNSLFRSRFSFPYAAAKTTLLINPAQAPRGGKVAVRVIPGADCADLGLFRLFADLPPGLDLLQKPAEAAYDAAARRLEWRLSAASQVRYVRLPIASIISASGWISPEKAIPNPMAQISAGPRNNFLFPMGWPGQSAVFLPGIQGSFRMAVPPAGLSADYPRILGVIFHNQLVSSRGNGPSGEELDRIHFNYSIRPDLGKALAEDLVVSRVGAGENWYDGYHDATEDRHWTWPDFSNLSLFISSQTMMNRDKAQLADAWVIVKCMQPAKISPVFYAQVSSPRCENLAIKAGIISPRFRESASDSLELKANPQGCPSPTPMPLPTAVQIAAPIPASAARPAQASAPFSAGRITLGCLQSSPEPFRAGGVFVMFCLKQAAKVSLEVYPESGGKALRRMEAVEFRSGNSQLFYNGMDDAGKPLKAGRYNYKLLVSDGKASALQESYFNKERARR